MTKTWLSTMILTLVGVLAFCLYVLWVGGGVTRGASWEFASWVGAALTAAAAALTACVTLFLRAARKTKEDGTPWSQRPVELTRATLTLSTVGLLLLGALTGGALVHVGGALRQENVSAGAPPGPVSPDTPVEPPESTTVSSPPSPEAGPPEIEEEDPPGDSERPFSERQSLTEVAVMESSHQYDSGTRTVNARTYSEAVSLDSCQSCYVDFDLGRRWTTFDATVGLSDDSQSGAEVTVRALADGEVVSTHTISLGEDKQISVSVEEALRLRLEAERVQGSGWTAVWGDPMLKS